MFTLTIRINVIFVDLTESCLYFCKRGGLRKVFSFLHAQCQTQTFIGLGTRVVTPPSLEPTTSRTPVQRSTTKPKVRTQARGRHYTPPPFLESLVFSSTRHHRLLPNQSPGRASQPHRPLNPQCRTTLGRHASACVRANTSDTKCCDSAESRTHDLSHTSPAFYH